MTNLARKSVRNLAKLKLKEMKKADPRYKNFKFSEFYALYKAGLIQLANKNLQAGAPPPHVHDEHCEHTVVGAEASDLDDMLMDDDIGE